MRDGHGPRVLGRLVRYCGSLLAELFRSLTAIEALRAQAPGRRGRRPGAARADRRQNQTNSRKRGKNNDIGRDRCANRRQGSLVAIVLNKEHVPTAVHDALAFALVGPLTCMLAIRVGELPNEEYYLSLALPRFSQSARWALFLLTASLVTSQLGPISLRYGGGARHRGGPSPRLPSAAPGRQAHPFGPVFPAQPALALSLGSSSGQGARHTTPGSQDAGPAGDRSAPSLVNAAPEGA
jgi:hypothetical protein